MVAVPIARPVTSPVEAPTVTSPVPPVHVTPVVSGVPDVLFEN
jgi:hypothetical protein